MSDDQAWADALAVRVGVAPPADPRLFQLALTHASRVQPDARRAGGPGLDNERLEFLGDAVLRLAISEHLYRAHPDLPEGEMSAIRAYVVSDENLARVATHLRLGDFLRLGDTERRSGGRAKPALLAAALEAVYGAIFLESGYAEAARVVQATLAATIGLAVGDRVRDNYKAVLQEYTQERLACLPVYEDAGTSGPPHARVFSSRVHVAGRLLGHGKGRTKKAAEQQAAQQAYDALRAEA